MRPNLTVESICPSEQQLNYRKPAVCILLENNPAPADRRVWQEACALREAGYHVSIISPKGLGLSESRQTIDGIDIYRHSSWEAQHAIGYFVEYLWALAWELLLVVKVYARTQFRVIQACNPPDHLFLIAVLFKPFGVRFIFDHHDLSLELFECKFGRKHRFLYRLLDRLEYFTFRAADVSLATNESYREIATGRGKMQPEQVFIVRSCLDLAKAHLGTPVVELKKGREYLVAYLGVINLQDGVDLLIESIDAIVNLRNRRDTQFALIGSGPEVPKLKRLVHEKHLDEFVTFTGWKSGTELDDYLSTANIAVAPDPATPLNDKSTMNKILHYMAYGLPIVQYDLKEGRRSAGDAALYARNDDPAEFADQIIRLLDSESLRKELGSRGRRRIEEELNWDLEKQHLLRAYDAALAPKSGRSKTRAPILSTTQEFSNTGTHTAPVQIPKYVIITPARDEEAHIERTILSVTRQTLAPAQWIIVNDGSRDSTGEIIDRYARQHSWITPVHRTNRGFRQAGGGVMNAFYDGYDQIRPSDWDFIVKLDADLGFSPEYFEQCFGEFARDPHLGIGGGGIYHQTNRGLQFEPTPGFHVRGATKIYRRACWDQLGGLVRAPGWDTIDEAKANMLGWRTRTFPHLVLSHYRPTGAADGTWRDSVKNGRANYISGYHPAFMFFKCALRLLKRPYFVGAAGLLWGFASAYWKRAPKVQDRPLINYIRAQQMRRLLFLDSIWK